MYASDGEKVGVVEYVLADAELDVFDGIVIDTSVLPGGQRFADASPDRPSIYEHGVILEHRVALTAEELPEPSDNPGVMAVTGIEDVDRSETREASPRLGNDQRGKAFPTAETACAAASSVNVGPGTSRSSPSCGHRVARARARWPSARTSSPCRRRCTALSPAGPR